MVQTLTPLFPLWIREAHEARGPHPEPEQERPGVMGPIAMTYVWDGRLPVVFVELAFFPGNDLPETLLPESWETWRNRARLSSLNDLAETGFHHSADFCIELGPTVVVRNADIELAMILTAPAGEWEDAVREVGGVMVIVGTGLAVDGSGRVIAPDSAVATLATHTGTFPASTLTGIAGLHTIPLNADQYDETGPKSFILDTDVFIAIERFVLSPKPRREKDPIRDLLLNLAYRDVLPGAALGQIYQPGRRRTDQAAVERAAKAIHEVMAWDRERIALHESPCATFRPGWLEEFTGTSKTDPIMLMLYLGVLRLRRMWSPAMSLQDKAAAFEAYVRWLRDDIQVASPASFQVAANLLISTDETHRKASRLLHFKNSPITQKTLDELWGAAFDISLVTGHAGLSLDSHTVEPVLLTFDKGLASLYELMRYVGFGPLPGEAGADAGYAFYVASNLDVHPRLGHLTSRVEEWHRQLQDGMISRSVQKRPFRTRRAEITSAVEDEEAWLLRTNG
jgi:hypothetical protein